MAQRRFAPTATRLTPARPTATMGLPGFPVDYSLAPDLGMAGAAAGATVGAAGAMAGAAGAVEATTEAQATAAKATADEAMLDEAMPAAPEVTRSTAAVDIEAPQAEGSPAAG